MRRLLQVLGVLLALGTVPAAAARKTPAHRQAQPAANPNAPAARPAANPNTPAAAASDPNAGLPAVEPEAADDGPDPLADRVIFYEYNHHVRPKEFNFSLGGPFNNVGLALWFAIPVLPDGLIPDVNDQLNVEVGLVAGLYRDNVYWVDGKNYFTVAVAAGMRWDFHVTQAWVPFALLKIAVNFGFDQIVLPGGGLGVLYRLSDDWRLRLELGYPLGMSAGLTFDLPAL